MCQQALSVALRNLREFAAATTAHNGAAAEAEAAATAEAAAAEASEAAAMGIEILGSEDDVIFISDLEPDEGEAQTDHVAETSDEDK